MIPLIKSSFFNEESTKKALGNFILTVDRFSMGEQCENFERAFSQKQNRSYSVFVSNGSAANLVLIQAFLNLGRLKKGDRVGISAVTWATNVMPLIQLGLIPVALDCELSTLNVSSRILEKEIDELDALFLTNALGFCDDIDRIKALCDEKNILFFEDNCESLGSMLSGKLLGNFGVASTFSFYIGHHLSTIEGGMICTDDEELYEMCILVRAHGWDRNLSENTQTKLRTQHGIDDFFARYTFYDLAYNCRPTEINGFIGNIQLKNWNTIVERRAHHFKIFCDAIQKNDAFIQIDASHMDLVSNFAMPLICKDSDFFHAYRSKFSNANVEIRPIIGGDITTQPFYKKYTADQSCPKSNTIHRNGFYFPNNPELTEEEIQTLCALLRP